MDAPHLINGYIYHKTISTCVQYVLFNIMMYLCAEVLIYAVSEHVSNNTFCHIYDL